MDTADMRDWLTRNGLGGYASGTVCGATTRRYHAPLAATLEPPSALEVLA
jgi:glycogen debranching enzyme